MRMTDAQLLTAIALATLLNVLAVWVGVLINNAHLSDFKSFMDARFDNIERHFHDIKDTLRAELR